MRSTIRSRLAAWLGRSAKHPLRSGRDRILSLEPLEDRTVPVATAALAGGVLTILGDDAGAGADDAIVVTRDAAGTITVTDSGNAVAIGGGPATIFNTARIDVFGLGGNDTISLLETNGPLPAAFIDGGPGSDNLTGGSSNDTLVGGSEFDSLNGGYGSDVLLGAGGDDFLNGGGPGAYLVGLTATNTLVRFQSATPNVNSNVAVVGLAGGETLVGIDFRPANGLLYGVTNLSQVYLINPVTGGANLVSTLTAAVSGASFGTDFNPVPDRLRVVGDADQNLRVNVDTGEATIDGPLAYAAGDSGFGINPNVVGSAYTNNFPGAIASGLYGIDSNRNVLVVQNPPNNGTLLTVGPLGVNPGGQVGFDIQGREAFGYAALTTIGFTGLYSINLATGAATLLGTIAGGGTPLIGLAVVPDDDLFLWNDGDGSDVVDGGPGNDRVVVQTGVANDAVFLNPNATNTRLLLTRSSGSPFTLDVGSVEVVDVRGGAGNDTVIAGDTSQVPGFFGLAAYGDGGNDVLVGTSDNDTLVGGDGDDYLQGNGGDDQIFGGLGNDSIDAGEGNDYAQGDDGNDLVAAQVGNDSVAGLAGDDQLLGGEGNDLLDGGDGNDGLYGDAGDDQILGGLGADLLIGGIGNDILNAGDGADYLQGDAGNDLAFGGAGNDSVDSGAGDDYVEGNDGDDLILTQAGNDSVAAGAGDDQADGGAGIDLFDGGPGIDFAVNFEIVFNL